MALLGSLTRSEFNTLCRLCASKTNVVMGLHIFEREGDMRQIYKKITDCLPIQVNCNDELPKMICEECVYKLEEFFDFREISAKTEFALNDMLKNNFYMCQTTGSIDIPMETLICEADPHHIKLTDGVQQVDLGSGSELDSIVLGSTHDDNVKCEPDLISVTPSNFNPAASPFVTNDPGLIADSNGVGGLFNNNLSDSQSYGSELTSNNGFQTESTDYVSDVACERSYVNTGSPSENDYIDTSGESETYITESNGETTYVTEAASQTSFVTDPTSESGFSADVDKCFMIDQGTDPPYISEEATDEKLVNDSVSEGEFLSGVAGDGETISNRLGVPTAEDITLANSIDSNCISSLQVDNVVSNDIMDSGNFDNGNSNNNPSNPSWCFCNFCGKASNGALCQHQWKKCSACEVHCATNEALLAHLQKCHIITDKKDAPSQSSNKSGIKMCPECGKEYRTNYKLAEHMRKHTGEKPFKCRTCDKTFRSKIGLAQHEAKHTGQYDFRCDTCGKGFQCKSYLVVHQRVHSNAKPYPCNQCDASFKTKQSLVDHQNRHLGVKPYLCEVCGRGFITKGLCKSHQKIHSGSDNRQYPCSVCHKLFVSKSYLNTHLRIHTGEKPFMCEVCGKGFLTRVDLKIHSTMHTGEKSFICETCGKAFARRDALRCHRRSHTGERPYRCDICGQCFTQYSPMAIHKRLHTGERPYACDLCPKTFVSKSTMMSHRKKHISNSLVDETKVSIDS